ncbi:hypothetical protein MC885_002171 [Smutsia gigantea]|nr:hypothetical protein MC885_002171 [Smutsia gigantea]
MSPPLPAWSCGTARGCAPAWHGLCAGLRFEFILSVLAEVVCHAQRPLVQAKVKSYLQMLLKGIAPCHASNIVQWDLKPANLLISALGQLKIADFGLPHWVSEEFRASVPACDSFKLDGNQGHGLHPRGVVERYPLFPGENDIEQLCCVLCILAHPALKCGQFAGCPLLGGEITELPDYEISFKDQARVPLGEVLPDPPLRPWTCGGTSSCTLHANTLQPPSSSSVGLCSPLALLHPYFFTASLPAQPSELLIPQCPRGPAPKAPPGPPHIRDFHVDRPLEESVEPRGDQDAQPQQRPAAHAVCLLCS